MLVKKWSALPESILGKVGLLLIGLFILLLALKISLPLPVPSFAIFGEGVVATALSIVAMARRDRSVLLLIVSALIGLFIVFFVGGEVLFPH